LPTLRVTRSMSRGPAIWLGESSARSQLPPSPQVWRKNSRAMYGVGSGMPTRVASPLGNPATPMVPLRPRPPATSGLNTTSPPGHSRAAANRVAVSVVAAGSSGTRLCGPT
jgi:hypothetical protein